MQVVTVGIERVICRILAGIGFVGGLVEADVELQDGVVPGRKFAKGEVNRSSRVGDIHLGEPVRAVKPGRGRVAVPAAEQAGTGEKVGKAGKLDLLPGRREEGRTWNGDGRAVPEVPQGKGDASLEGRAESDEPREPEQASDHFRQFGARLRVDGMLLLRGCKDWWRSECAGPVPAE